MNENGPQKGDEEHFPLSPDENKTTTVELSASSIAKKRNSNIDQEVNIDSQAPIILLNDLKSHQVSSQSNGRLPPILSRKAEIQNPIIINSSEKEGDKYQDEVQPNPEEEYKEEDDDSHSQGSQSKQQEEVDIFKSKDSAKQRCETLSKFLKNKYVQILLFVCTIFALFAADVRAAALTKASDPPLDIITIIVMTVFVGEITLSILTQPNYICSFFFWLDLISTASLLFDISLFLNVIIGAGTETNINVARASRASRVGTKAARIVRIVRLIRLVRIVKIYKQAKVTQARMIEARNRKNTILALNAREDRIKNSTIRVSPVASNNPDLRNFPASPRIHENAQNGFMNSGLGDSNNPYGEQAEVSEEEENMKESRVGRKMSDLTTKRVITIVLLLLFIVPLFDTDTYFDPDNASLIAANTLRDLIVADPTGDNGVEAVWNQTIYYMTQPTVFQPLIYMSVPTMSQPYQTEDLTTLRDTEFDECDADFNGTDLNLDPVRVVIDLREGNRLDAELSIGRTLYVCVILTVGALIFSRDVNVIALVPLERMITKVNKLAQDPLSSKEDKLVQDKTQMQNEIIQIENSISKIGTLLALGFGEAGTAIIAQNMADGGDVNPMIRGQKKIAIFGFCDIRNFTDATEVLQEEVMVFVNSIGEIVHRIVDKYGGAANKNIGDAFLLVWKFSDHDIKHDNEGNVTLLHNKSTQNLCDLAVISFLKIYARINKDPVLLAYRKNKKLNQRIKNYKVKMGFGLHVGWAIEGAIGSEFKIDASYLSPNVNMASRLEAATKQYGVPLLISGALYEFCSPAVRQKLRHIDRVTVKGSKQPIDFYTVDCLLDELPRCTKKELSKEEIKYRRKVSKKNIKARIIEGGSKASTLFDTDKDLYAMTKSSSSGPFNGLFKAGFKAYLDGDWSQSKRKLEECLNLIHDDGPTHTLYDVMKESNFIAPQDWKGFRVLTEK